MVSADSPLFRDKFDPIKNEGRWHHGQTRRDAKDIVIPMTGPSIRQYYNRLLFAIGIRSKKKRRHDFSVHGFRKYFKTRTEQAGMKPIDVEILMGHSVGISDSYYRPTENELLQDYLHVKDALTISQENRLSNEVEARGKSIEANLREKDSEIAGLREKYDTDIALSKEAMLDMQQLLKDPEKLAEISRAAKAEILR